MTQHHPSEATLLAYAAGSATEGISLAVAGHLAFCAACREAIADAEAIGGELLDEIAPAPLASAGTDAILARLDTLTAAVSQEEVTNDTDATENAALPGPLARYVANRAGATGSTLTSLPWRRLWLGMQQVDLGTADGGGKSLRLLRVAPGRALPHHGHHGTELTLVLSGSFSDENGRYVRGDVVETDSDVKHRPMVDGSEECICLIVNDAPIRLGGLMGRIARFVRA